MHLIVIKSVYIIEENLLQNTYPKKKSYAPNKRISNS